MIVLVCFFVSGMTVAAMEAINLYRQRMEAMNKETMDEYYTIAMAGETTCLSRPYTEEEKNRYEELQEEYEKNGVFPKSQVIRIENADEYDGRGVALDVTNATLYLPEAALSDEELLEIIDLEHKVVYSIYRINEERIISGSDWESRMAAMDDEEVDRIYLIMYTTTEDISGGYSRQLTEDESRRYEDLTQSYEKEGVYTTSEPTVIQNPEEYTGEGVAICIADSRYYLPKDELSDEELLEIIDFEHKGPYCLTRIASEISMGLRDGYPKP